MPNYVIAYFGGPEFDSPESGKAYQQKWMAWIQGVGEAAVNPAMPLSKTKVLRTDGVTEPTGKDGLTGFTIVKAESVDAAVELAKGCPHLEFGRLEISEVEEFSM